jgi:hypothetical protein
VALSETAESIGYKLLPYANDLGDWLVKDGIPGSSTSPTSEAGARPSAPRPGWLGGRQQGRDGGPRQRGGGHGHPGHEDVGHAVGDAVAFFNELPDPVKRTGIEAGIAAVAVTRLSNAINGESTAVGINTSKISNWRKGLLITAGVGGLTAITKGRTEATRRSRYWGTP